MLTLQFVPYHEIEHLNSQRRVRKLIDIAKENKIVLLEGRLKKAEEGDLIKRTMEEISSSFKGIELAVINPEKKEHAILAKLKSGLINTILGDRQGITIIGPANIIKEIKKDPSKVQLLVKEAASKKRR
jgi:hypothetical protein